MCSAEKFPGILTVKKPVKSSQKKFLLFLNTNPLPPVSLGFLNRQSQIPFRQAASDVFQQSTLSPSPKKNARERRNFEIFFLPANALIYLTDRV